MSKTLKNYLGQIEFGTQERQNPEILRIIVGSELTRIDFAYVAPWIYDRGGWIRIAAETYLQVIGSKKKYQLLKAINIPIAPEQLHFESTADWHTFSLLFEPIPMKDCQIDLIEAEQADETDFNYYGITVNISQKIEILAT